MVVIYFICLNLGDGKLYGLQTRSGLQPIFEQPMS